MAKAKIHKSAGKAVGTTYSDSPTEGKKQESHGFPVLLGEGPHANVNVSMGARVGLPNYSDARCGASLTLPSDADEEAIEAAFDFAKRWVERKVEEMVDEIQAENG